MENDMKDLEVYRHRSGREVVVHGHSFGYVTVRERYTLRKSRIRADRMVPPLWRKMGDLGNKFLRVCGE